MSTRICESVHSPAREQAGTSDGTSGTQAAAYPELSGMRHCAIRWELGSIHSCIFMPLRYSKPQWHIPLRMPYTKLSANFGEHAENVTRTYPTV